MTTLIIISILLIGTLLFIAGYNLGYFRSRKKASSAIKSWKANYLYKNNSDYSESFGYHENNISWETDNTFNENTYDFYYNIDFTKLNWYDRKSNNTIKEKIKEALDVEDYEKAAEYRDLLKSLDKSSTD